MMRVRLRFSKLGKVRFTSHRDVARMWERALRRAELPVVYSEGFSPRPRLHFGLALSTGHESLAEYVDVDLVDEAAATLDIGQLPSRLTPALPTGIDVTAAAVLPGGTPSLQHAVTSCGWRISVVADP
jgi:radical SAM-linked protein